MFFSSEHVCIHFCVCEFHFLPSLCSQLDQIQGVRSTVQRTTRRKTQTQRERRRETLERKQQELLAKLKLAKDQSVESN